MIDEKSIYEELPQLPYVVDQVGAALSWAKEALGEGEYLKTLRSTLDVVRYAKKVSEPNFYKTHLVVANILSSIEGALESERFTQFDTASKAVENTLKAITVNDELSQKYGCFKSTAMTLVPLAGKDRHAFTVALIGALHDIKEVVGGMETAKVKVPITPKDYVLVLGYATIIDCMRISKISMTDETYEIYNQIVTLLDGINY